MTTRRVVWGVGALLVCWVLSAGASTPRFWLVSTQAEMLKGDVDGLAIDDTGRLVLGPAVKTLLEPAVPFFWCLAAGTDGSVYAGSGNDGQVWRVDPQGKASVFYKAPELEVHAMVTGPDGTLYVATSPEGKVYRVDQTGHATTYFDPPDKYIWALVIDPQGRLYVGTGDKGVIYRVAAAGQGDVWYRTNTKNVTALALDRDGQLLATTDSPGRLLRVDGTAHGFALFDAPFRELRAIRVAPDGAIYVAAVNGKAGGGGDDRSGAAPSVEPPKTPTAGVSTEIMSVTIIDMPGSSAASSPSAPKSAEKSSSKGAVYRIEKNGRPDIVWESRDDVPFDVALDGDGVLVSTGNGGKLYRVSGNPSHTALLARMTAQQVTAMLAVGSVRYLATSNPGKVFAAARDRRTTGEYLSDVKDAGMAATWGTISWRATEPHGSRVQLMTRSGNTSEPDDTWSPWTPAYAHADGDQVASPSSRYLQWKATLTGTAADAAGPALVSVKVGYQQHNARPHVTGITVLPAGTVYQKPYPTGDPDIAGMAESLTDARAPLYSLPLGTAQPGQMGRRMYQKGLQAFTWKADDDNDDRLTYDVSYRRVDAVEWRPLRKGLNDTILTWDTTSVPDGTYLIKVTASDALGNGPTDALTGEQESEAFDIDNTPPVISVIGLTRDGGRATVTIEVRDAHSPIGPVEYSIDAGRWQTLRPQDGIADRSVERYSVTVEGTALGRLVVRAADTLNNLATLKVDERR